MSDLGSNDSVSNIYSERNLAAMAFARSAAILGWRVGWVIDPADPAWPILIIDTPEGQVSWHIPGDEATVEFGKYEGKWDGHTTEQKNTRLLSFATRQSPRQPQAPSLKENDVARLAAKWLDRAHDDKWNGHIRNTYRQCAADLTAALNDQVEGRGVKTTELWQDSDGGLFDSKETPSGVFIGHLIDTDYAVADAPGSVTNLSSPAPIHEADQA